MDEIEFWHNLLKETEQKFQESKTIEEHRDKNWNFAICETPIQKETGIFFGLNWGGKDIDPQTAYPVAEKERNWNFVSHSRRYFREYLKSEIEQLNYSNLCFFRSPKAHQIEPDDWALAIPLFQKYIEFIKPPWTLLLGKPDHLLPNYLSDLKTIPIWDSKKNKKAYGYTGTLFGEYPFGAVPHPQAKISTDTRRAIWQSVVKDNNHFKI